MTWHTEQASWPILSRLKRIAIGATGGRGYFATFADVDTLGRPIAPIFWAGTAPHLTRYKTLASARAHAIPLPIENIWSLTDEAPCRFVRLYHQAIDDAPYRLRVFHPHLLNAIREADDAT
jgi:hypothetical protein